MNERPRGRFFQRRLVGAIPPMAPRPVPRREERSSVQGAPAPALVNVNGIRVAPALVPYVQRLRDGARRMGLRFVLVSGYRSNAEQAALRVRWAAGDPSIVFPPAEYSYHTLGLAVDVGPERTARALGPLAESIGMRWGGRFGDPVHFDLGRS